MNNAINRGMVLGKFLPPHKGHQYLIEYANQRVDELYIVVDNIFDEIISVSQRMAWIQAICPTAIVITLKHELPQSPEETSLDFWSIWEKGLKEVLPHPINTVFASEIYGETLASVLGAQFEMVDFKRKHVPISATVIRNQPYKYWDYIADVAKPHFCKKVCIFGPESVGKSTLTEQLASHYQTNFVPEYARKVIEENKGKIEYHDIEKIAYGHEQTIKEELKKANKILFVDTDAITTKIWSEELFGKYPDILDEFIEKTTYDLYLLLNIDVPWIDDIVRYRPNDREQFFVNCKSELEKYNKPFVIISGTWNERWNQALLETHKLCYE